MRLPCQHHHAKDMPLKKRQLRNVIVSTKEEGINSINYLGLFCNSYITKKKLFQMTKVH